MIASGKAFVRIAQLRGRVAQLARGGRYDVALDLLDELIRADLTLGLPADALLRARQAAALADGRGEPVAGPLAVLAATCLTANALEEAVAASATAIARALPSERARIEPMARLVGGAAQRRLGHYAEAHILLDAARGAAARLGETALAGFALVELAWVDLAEDRPAAAATCFEFGAEFLRRAGHSANIDADALAVAAWAAASEIDRATERGAIASDAARMAQRLELVAYIDGVLADLVLRAAPEAATEACALAAESATELDAARPATRTHDHSAKTQLARELVAQARLRQARTSQDRADRDRHFEAGIDLVMALDKPRASARLGALLFDLIDDAERSTRNPEPSEMERVVTAITTLGDEPLVEMARNVLQEFG
ncbi:MAG: hypothetical protein QM831_41360 [Kofleriaceae bacterium]